MGKWVSKRQSKGRYLQARGDFRGEQDNYKLPVLTFGDCLRHAQNVVLLHSKWKWVTWPPEPPFTASACYLHGGLWQTACSIFAWSEASRHLLPSPQMAQSKGMLPVMTPCQTQITLYWRDTQITLYWRTHLFYTPTLTQEGVFSTQMRTQPNAIRLHYWSGPNLMWTVLDLCHIVPLKQLSREGSWQHIMSSWSLPI